MVVGIPPSDHSSNGPIWVGARGHSFSHAPDENPFKKKQKLSWSLRPGGKFGPSCAIQHALSWRRSLFQSPPGNRMNLVQDEKLDMGIQWQLRIGSFHIGNMPVCPFTEF